MARLERDASDEWADERGGRTFQQPFNEKTGLTEQHRFVLVARVSLPASLAFVHRSASSGIERGNFALDIFEKGLRDGNMDNVVGSLVGRLPDVMFMILVRRLCYWAVLT
jgi:hypothetical protein